jgi:hypothetical protein
MGQSIGSVGNSHKQAGAGNQKSDQPSVRPGQKVSDQEQPVPAKGRPDGGIDRGPRAGR